MIPAIWKTLLDFAKVWLNLAAIQRVVHHASGALPAVLTFMLTARVVRWAVDDPPIQHALDRIEAVVLVTIFAVLGVNTLIPFTKDLWRQIWKGNNEGR